MSYRELVANTTRDAAEALSDALLDQGALSVSIEDADADTADEQPVFGEPGMLSTPRTWHHSRIVALLSPEQDAVVLLDAAAGQCGIAAPSFTLRVVEDQDWVRLTQSQFEPIAIGKRIWVVPSWHDAPDPQALILELDPGLAFGTGSHPTTQLCMEWIEQHVPSGASVLDYGCGSGILAILARKCGATDVWGIDIDPQAVETACANAQRNGLQAATDAAPAALHFALPDACPDRQFDIVVANILSNPLKVLAAMLCTRVRPGGQIALSGILARQAAQIAAAYAPWIALDVWREHEGWVCMAGRRPPADAV